ncbi:MAG TPA: 50S ribosomal protein L25 [Elusimicrobia bacterium]|nr:50S ribosomal protein L25 [Elusimicrobiota bacterium]
MEQIIVEAQLRDKIGGKKGLSLLRQGGSIPAVIYGTGKPAVHVTVGEKEILTVLKKGANSVVKLKYSDNSDTVILKEVQKHVVTGKLLHIDFQRISMTDKIKVKVRVKLVGDAYGVKVESGIVEHNMRELNVLCLPTDIPKEIEINITELHLGGVIRVKDVKSDKAEIIEDAEHIVVSVTAPKEEKVETPLAAAGASAAEPEVIAKGKKEEGEDGAAPDAAKGAKAAEAGHAGKPEDKKPAAPKK